MNKKELDNIKSSAMSMLLALEKATTMTFSKKYGKAYEEVCAAGSELVRINSWMDDGTHKILQGLKEEEE